MDYKKVLSNEGLRFKILKLLEFIPDKYMIHLQYFIKFGRILNLKNPKRYTEKLQWYKLYYRDPLMTQCADKYRVREYIVSKGFENILIPLYGVYDNANDINFDILPNKFVLKTTNGSHTNILCDNKEELNKFETKKKLNHWLNNRTPKAGREWAYYDIEPKVICEKHLTPDKEIDLIDYKFICFNGKISNVFVNAERESNNGMLFDIYNAEFEKMPFKRRGLRNTETAFPKPKNYQKMKSIAEKLSNGFPHVRIDLYNLDGKIYFGEMTFYHASGYIEFEPDDFDYQLGDLFPIEKMKF